MTVNELKSYIRNASVKIATDRNSRYKAVASSAEYIADSLGVKRTKNPITGKYKVSLKLGFKGMRKSDLLNRARLMQGHFKIDVYSRNAKQYIEQVTDESIERLYQNTGIRLKDKEDMATFKLMMSQIKDVVQQFGSDNIAKLYDEMNQKHGEKAGLTLGSIAMEVFDNLPKGIQQREAMEALETYIEMMYGEA